MTFYSLAQRIAKGDTTPLESYLMYGYDSGIHAQLLTQYPNQNVSMIIPDPATKEEWFRIKYTPIPDYLGRTVASFKLQKDDNLIIAKFVKNLSQCQTIADLILATNGEIKNVAIFKASLQIIKDRISILDLENPSSITKERQLEIEKRTSNIIQVTTRVINLCHEFFALKGRFHLSKASLWPLETLGVGIPLAPCPHFTNESLLCWARSLSSEQKEKVVFFDFNQYPELTSEIPSKLKEIFPNLSFSCFGTLPDSMCDVTLFGDSTTEETFEAEKILEKESKDKEKEVWDEETEKYYFPPGNKRKGSAASLNQSNPKRLKLSLRNRDLENSKGKEKVESGEDSKVNETVSQEGIKTNKKILASSSKFFEQLFYGGFEEENRQEISLKDVKAHILKMCMDAFYLKTDLNSVSLEDLFEVYKTASYLDLKAPKSLAETQIRSLLENSGEELFLEEEMGKEKEADGIGEEEKKAKALETSIQKMGQCYLNVSHIFLIEPNSLLKKAIVQFLQKKLLSVNASSYRSLFVRFLEANLPLAEIIQEFQANGKVPTNLEEFEELNKLYRDLCRASLLCQGQSFKEILKLCREYWKLRPTRGNSLRNHIWLVDICLEINSSIQVKKVLLASLLKAAQVGDDETVEPIGKEPLLGRSTEYGKDLKNKFFTAYFKLNKSIKGESFEISKRETDQTELFFRVLRELPRQALCPEELKIRNRSVSIAAKLFPDSKQFFITSQILTKWDKSKPSDSEIFSGEQKNAILLLKYLFPEVAGSNKLKDYLSLGLTSNNPVVLSACSVLHYYAFHQDWNKIFETSYLALKYDSRNELALSLYGASLVQLAKVKPEESKDLLDLAKQNLDESLIINPQNTIALTYLANWHLAKQDTSKAIDIFKTIKNVELTTDNFQLVKQMLFGSNEEMEEGFKILLRTLENHKKADINWFHLMSMYALNKKDAKLLSKLKTFFEDCFKSGLYTINTLHILDVIYKEEALVGPIEKEKKQQLYAAIKNKKTGGNTLQYFRKTTPPSAHLSLYTNRIMLPVLDLNPTGEEPMDLSQFNLEEYLMSLDNGDPGEPASME